MKKLCILFVTFLSLSTYSQNTVKLNDIELKKGLHLVYNISKDDRKYQYIVDFISADVDKEVVFNWEMTDPINKSGTTTISSESLEKATNLDFHPSTRTFDGNEISMIFSKKIYEQLTSLKEMGPVIFGCNACLKDVIITDVQNSTYKVADQTNKILELNTLSFSSQSNNGSFQILNNPGFPLIIYFDFNMTIIELKSYSFIN